MKMRNLVIFATMVLAAAANAKDMGFRYKNGACVDDNGKAGLNPGYIGQCADLKHVTMSRFEFDGSDLSGTVFEDADLQDATFVGSTLAGVSFASANLSGAIFDNAIATDVNFQKAIMINTHLGAATLKNPDLRGADLSKGMLSYISFPGGKLAGAIFDYATMDHANLATSDLTSVSFEGVNLTAANLDSTKIGSANFASADLTGASLKHAAGAEVKFRRATLRHADLTGANINGSDCFFAQMDSAIMNKGTFDNVDFRSAVLKDATTADATFKGAQFSKHTVLPFSDDDAKKLGMVAGKSGSLLIILDNNSDQQKSDVETLKDALLEQGIDLTISPENHSQFDGKMNLSDYSTILHVTGSDYSDDMPMTGQIALVKFVTAGGTYIGTQYSGYMIDQNNELQGLRDLLLIGYQNTDNNPHTYAAVADKASHPLLYNVQSFSLTADHSLAPLHEFDKNPAYVVMQDDQQFPMLAAREFGKGKVVGFAFAINDDFQTLIQPAVQQLITNAVYW